MEGESRNLQNDFFNEARKARTTVSVFLSNGKKLTGRIKSFDKFTLLLEGHQGELMVFKHAISTVSPAPRTAGNDSGEAERRQAQPAGVRSGAGRDG
jgi:host factor-I protein